MRVAILVVAAGVVNVALAGAPARAQPNKTIFGESQPTDYTAKHFSLVSGAVILNPFDFRRVMGAGTDGETGGTGADGTTTAPEFDLGRGSREANAFLEAGFRWRWAWLDRLGPAPAARAAALAEAGPEEKATLLAAEHELSAAKDLEAAATLRKKVAATEETRAEAETGLKAATVAREEAEGRFAHQRDRIVADGERKAIQQWRDAVGAPRYCCFPECVREEGGKPLIPTDWTIRGGLAFGKDTSLEASSLAGGSDFYTEAQVGWPLVRWSMATVSPEETPIRASINFEPKYELVTDRDLVDVHDRLLIGLSAVVGVPLGLRAKDDDSATDAIVEFLLHAGATRVEVPQFLDKTSRRVKIENELPDFASEWGVGVDLEINVPISKPLGYFMVRSSINAGIDANPWTVRLGYTVPLATLVSAAGLKTGG